MLAIRSKGNLRDKRENAVPWLPSPPHAPKSEFSGISVSREQSLSVTRVKVSPYFKPHELQPPSDPAFPDVHVFISLLPQTCQEHNSPEQNLARFRQFCRNSPQFPGTSLIIRTTFSSFSWTIPPLASRNVSECQNVIYSSGKKSHWEHLSSSSAAECPLWQEHGTPAIITGQRLATLPCSSGLVERGFSAGNGLNSLLFAADSQLPTTCTLDAPDLARNKIGAEGLSRSQTIKLCSKKPGNPSLQRALGSLQWD